MTAVSPESVWRVGTVETVRPETTMVRTFVFRLDDPVAHLAGSHYELRLTSEDGYSATRLYSAASVGDGGNLLELTIAMVPHGEVSSYMFNNVVVGSQIELRGPLTHFFTWDPAEDAPALLIGGGSGVVPMRAMLQAHAKAGATAPMTLLYSSRTVSDIIYRAELDALTPPLRAVETLTDSHPGDWTKPVGFITKELLMGELARFDPVAPPTCYICGSTPFVEAMANSLVELGVSPEKIRAERFGPIA
jgi:ferredoxin-NADP reductase